MKGPDGLSALPRESCGTRRPSLVLRVRSVAAGEGLPALDLDIPTPGRALTTRAIAPDGTPHSIHRVTLDLPPGPLTERQRFQTLKTGPNGELRLDGLAAGEHRFEIDGRTAPFGVTIPAIEAPAATPPLAPLDSPSSME